MKPIILLEVVLFWIYLNFPNEAEALEENSDPHAERQSPIEYPGVLNIDVAIMVMFVGEYDILNMEFELDLFISMDWDVEHDLCERDLKKLAQMRLNPLKSQFEAIVPPENVNDFWVPDIFIDEAKDVKMSSEVVPTASLRIEQTSNKSRPKNETAGCRYHYKIRQQCMINCQGDFRRFPFDVQRCPVNIHSFTFAEDALVIHWKSHHQEIASEDIFRVEPTMQMLEYTVDYIIKSSSDTHWTQLPTTWNLTYERSHWTDNRMHESFRGVKIELNFYRRFTYQLISTFIPSILLVIVALSSFSMSVTSSAGRIQLTTTVLLSLYTICNGIRFSLPSTSYLTCSDVFLFGCMFFVTVITIEAAVIEKIYRNEKLQNMNRAKDRKQYAGKIHRKPSTREAVFKQEAAELRKHGARRSIQTGARARSTIATISENQPSSTAGYEQSFISDSSTMASLVDKFLPRSRVAWLANRLHMSKGTNRAEHVNRLAGYIVVFGLVVFLIGYFATILILRLSE